MLDAVVEAAAAGQGARQGVGAAAQGPPSAAVGGVLRAVGRLFALRAVEADLPWFIAEGELPAKVGLPVRVVAAAVTDGQAGGPRKARGLRFGRGTRSPSSPVGPNVHISQHAKHFIDFILVTRSCLFPLPQAGRTVPEAVRCAVVELSPHAAAVVDSFAIPDHLLAAPIAGDWARYNEVDNKGELWGVHV